jgi:hypothetical protein
MHANIAYGSVQLLTSRSLGCAKIENIAFGK